MGISTKEHQLMGEINMDFETYLKKYKTKYSAPKFATYKQYLQYMQDERSAVNNFLTGKVIFIFCFTEDEFVSTLKNEYGLEPSEVMGLGAGGYCRKSDFKIIDDFMTELLAVKQKVILANLLFAIEEALWNLEYVFGNTSWEEIWDYLSIDANMVESAGISWYSIQEVKNMYMNQALAEME